MIGKTLVNTVMSRAKRASPAARSEPPTPGGGERGDEAAQEIEPEERGELCQEELAEVELHPLLELVAVDQQLADVGVDHDRGEGGRQGAEVDEGLLREVLWGAG